MIAERRARRGLSASGQPRNSAGRLAADKIRQKNQRYSDYKTRETNKYVNKPPAQPKQTGGTTFAGKPVNAAPVRPEKPLNAPVFNTQQMKTEVAQGRQQYPAYKGEEQDISTVRSVVGKPNEPKTGVQFQDQQQEQHYNDAMTRLYPNADAAEQQRMGYTANPSQLQRSIDANGNLKVTPQDRPDGNYYAQQAPTSMETVGPAGGFSYSDVQEARPTPQTHAPNQDVPDTSAPTEEPGLGFSAYSPNVGMGPEDPPAPYQPVYGGYNGISDGLPDAQNELGLGPAPAPAPQPAAPTPKPAAPAPAAPIPQPTGGYMSPPAHSYRDALDYGKATGSAPINHSSNYGVDTGVKTVGELFPWLNELGAPKGGKLGDARKNLGNSIYGMQ